MQKQTELKYLQSPSRKKGLIISSWLAFRHSKLSPKIFTSQGRRYQEGFWEGGNCPLNFGSCTEANPLVKVRKTKQQIVKSSNDYLLKGKKKKKFRSLLEHIKIQQFVFEFPRPLILPDHQIFRSSDVPVHNLLSFCVIRKEKQKIFRGDQVVHGLRTPGEDIVFTELPKIHYHSQIFRYSQSIFCLPHQPKFSDIFDL